MDKLGIFYIIPILYKDAKPLKMTPGLKQDNWIAIKEIRQLKVQ